MTVNFNCEWAKESISAYLDGELNTEDKERLESHLNDCELCREYLRTLRFIKDELSKSGVEPPADLHESVMTKIRSDSPVLDGNKKGFLKILKGRRTISYVAAAVAAIAILSPVISDYALGGLGGSDKVSDSAYEYEILATSETESLKVTAYNMAKQAPSAPAGGVETADVSTAHIYNAIDVLPVVYTDEAYRAIIMYDGETLPTEVADMVGVLQGATQSFAIIDEDASKELLEDSADMGISLYVFDDVQKYPKLSLDSESFLFFLKPKK